MFRSLLIASFIAGNAMAIDARTAARANNDFGVNLFKGTTVLTPKGNKFVSPTSAFLALSILNNGAEASTRTGIEKALSLSGVTRDELNDANLLLQSKLTTGRDFTLGIANSLWGKKDYELKQTFMDIAKTNYSAEVAELDFSLPISVTTINDWVSKATRGKIAGIVSAPLPADLRMILINATYFDAKWTQKFDPHMTQEGQFHKADGTAVKVPFLNAIYQNGQYVQTAEYEAITLPYGKAKDADMIVVVPKNLAAFEKSLTGASWQQLVASLDASQPGEGEFSMPSLEFSTDISLNNTLATLGMGEAFDKQHANFDSLSDEDLYVSDVKHKTYVKVFEEGTIAAAITSISIGASPAHLFKFRLNVDRPYLFAIRDKRTGALLFMGSVQEPEGGLMPEVKIKPGKIEE